MRSKKISWQKGAAFWNASKGTYPQVSRAVPTPSSRNRCSSSAAKSGWARGSPPLSVTPPSARQLMCWAITRLHQGPGVKRFTDPAQRAGAAGPGTGKAAPAGRRGPPESGRRPPRRQPVGHAAVQARQPMHLEGRQLNSGSACCDSGLAHHSHRSGQPFRKIRSRMPGPSWRLKRCTLKMVPTADRLMPPHLPPADGYSVHMLVCSVRLIISVCSFSLRSVK